MKLFKDANNELYGLNADGSQDELIKPDFIQISTEEAAVITASKLPPIDPKDVKNQQLAELTVTTSNGNVFDGNETARVNMLSAINASAFLNQTTANWKLADNTVVNITLDELKEALALSIQQVGIIVTS